MIDHLLQATVFSSPSQALLTAAVLMVAELVTVLFGFGSGLIAVGALAMVLAQVQDVLVILLCLVVPAEVCVVWAARKVIAWREVAQICGGIALGVPAGTWALQRGGPAVILPLLGGLLLLVGLLFLLLREAWQVRWPRWAGPLLGLLGGFLGGMFGTGGPPLILYYRLAGVPKRAFRGNLMAIFFAISLVRLPSYLVAGLLTPRRLASAALVAPLVLLGAYLGHRVHLQLSERAFQRLVAGALCVLGAMLLLR